MNNRKKFELYVFLSTFSRNLIEVTYESLNSPEGKNIVIGSPLFLTRETSDTFVDIILEPEKTQKTLSIY